jgi:hypothetical protein
MSIRVDVRRVRNLLRIRFLAANEKAATIAPRKLELAIDGPSLA